MQGRNGTTIAVASALAGLLTSTRAFAASDGASEPLVSAALAAELFAILTFVLLAVAAHWAARRERSRS